MTLTEHLVWMDYRLAVIFTVLIPLILLIWSFTVKSDAIQHLVTIYWKVSSLLAITVYLMIAALPISFISAIAARILIPISLWFWVDLNEEIEEQPDSLLKLSFTAWRWAMTVYMTVGALLQIPVTRCGFWPKNMILGEPSCRIWLDAPWGYKEMFHANSSPGFLGFLGIVGLMFYAICFTWFVVVRLGKQGRSATGN
ncbi:MULTISPECIES: DUF3177 family protein [Planktothricoides]|uniref:DUF3177 family protein n=2 Tax=Planktothricoides raciborskii TaxID=132608 RepID=A0AAU8J7C6_9CYAN|nr:MULTISPECIES: DUF3177 family protein [Planktothricoides]